jgi:hypothetical protein
MADNYIGQRMEDYRSGKLSAPRARKFTPSGQRPGHLEVKFPQINVFVSSCRLSAIGQAVIRVLVNSGCHVEFAAANVDAAAAQAFAQQSGARFLPGNGDCRVATADVELSVDEERGVIDIATSQVQLTWLAGDADLEPEQIAAAAAFLCTPTGRQIRHQSIRLG